MIVRYVRERGYKGEGKDESLTLGAKYFVFTIGICQDGSPNQIIVRSDWDGYPIVFDYAFFDVVDPGLPDGWCFNHLSDDYQRLWPKEFSGDFWDLYHDGDEEAEAIFEEVAKKIEHFHALNSKGDVCDNIKKRWKSLATRD